MEAEVCRDERTIPEGIKVQWTFKRENSEAVALARLAVLHRCEEHTKFFIQMKEKV